MKNRQHDMTTGSTVKLLLSFLVPVLLGNIFQQFYNIVDSVIVGRFLGVNALAAVGSTSSLTFLVFGLVMGMTSGFGIVLSQEFGAKRESKLRHYLAISIYLTIFLTIVFTAGLLLANGGILHLLNTPDTIYTDTYRYIAIIYAGLPATYAYNLLASIARALGDSKTPLYFLVFSSILNIGLDLLFIAVLPFGVMGAAGATILSQAISAILCFFYVKKHYPVLRIQKGEAAFSWSSVRRLMSMGIPMALQFSITAMGTMIVQSALNLLGAAYIASFAAASKITNILMQPYTALGAAIATFVGQNYGAGKIRRIRECIRYSCILEIIYAVLAMAFAYFICPSLIQIFVDDPTGELREIARQIYHISLVAYVPLGMIFIFRNALQGLGNGFVPMLGGVFELAARGLAIVLLFNPLGFTGICISDPAAWVSALIPLVPYYVWYMRKKTKEMGAI